MTKFEPSRGLLNCWLRLPHSRRIRDKRIGCHRQEQSNRKHSFGEFATAGRSPSGRSRSASNRHRCPTWSKLRQARTLRGGHYDRASLSERRGHSSIRRSRTRSTNLPYQPAKQARGRRSGHAETQQPGRGLLRRIRVYGTIPWFLGHSTSSESRSRARERAPTARLGLTAFCRS